MPNRMNDVVRHLRQVILQHGEAGLTDGELLGHVVERRDEGAFAALVRRHGPMVWGVCRRVLRNHHDAEDAFQATFLVLVRKAASIKPRAMVGNWLYGVAQRTALNARAMLGKHRTMETQVNEMPEGETSPGAWRDLQVVLDQELSRLPQKYRAAIVLCDLEGMTRKQAARHLGLPEGTVAGRLMRGRAILARRLTRQGLGLTSGVLVTTLPGNVATASVPPLVLASTFKAAAWAAAGQTAATGAVSAKVVILTQGVLKSMLLTKLKTAAAMSLCVCLLATGLGATILADKNQPAGGQPQTERRVAEGTSPVSSQDSPTQVTVKSVARRLQDLENENKALRKELETLRKEAKPAAAAQPKLEIKIFRLRESVEKNGRSFTGVTPEEVAKLLYDLFNAHGQGRKLQMVALPGTNSVLVRGTAADVEAASETITLLERNIIEHFEASLRGEGPGAKGK